MIDTMEEQCKTAAALEIPEVVEENYAVMTLHRPSNVDHKDIFPPHHIKPYQ